MGLLFTANGTTACCECFLQSWWCHFICIPWALFGCYPVELKSPSYQFCALSTIQLPHPCSSKNLLTQPRQGTEEEDNWPLAPQRDSLQRFSPCPLSHLCVSNLVCLTCEIGLDLRKYFSSVVLLTQLISTLVYLRIGGFHLSSRTNWVSIAHRPPFLTIVKKSVTDQFGKNVFGKYQHLSLQMRYWTATLNCYFLLFTYKNELEQDYEQLKQHHLKKKTLFKDKDFPNNDYFIYDLGVSPRDLKWKRPGNIVKKPKFFSDGAQRFDVQQGEIGDCWLLAGNFTLHFMLH